MTAKKVYKKGNYLIVEDYDENLFYEETLVDVRVSKQNTDSEVYNLYFISKNEIVEIDFDFLAKEDNTAYATIAEWETFIFGCTGHANCVTTGGGGGGATNLSYTASPTNGIVISDTGTDATIPLVNNTNAGLQSPTDKIKLDGIETGAEVNVNADWLAISGDAFILNKPTSLPTSTVKHIVKYGVALTIGQAVYVSSADGTNMIVSKADYSSESTSSKTMGLVNQSGALNFQGEVITEGLLAGLDTSLATIGDAVWLGDDGNLLYGLANKPVAPNHMVFIGIVTRVNSNNGEIFVKVQNGFEFQELHNVLIQSLVDKDIIYWDNATQLFKNGSVTSVLGYTPTNQTRQINTTTPLQGGGDLTVDRTLSILQANTSHDGYLSATDWNTFNGKQDDITLTTTGNTGVATLVGNTLNIPNYTSSSNDLFKLGANEFFRGITINNNSTSLTAEGGVVMSTTASTQAQSVANTAFNLKNIRLRYYATVVSSGRYTGTRGSSILFYIGGGFRYVCSFAISDSALGSGCRQFFGMAGQSSDLAYSDTILVSSIPNIIGIGSDALDTNLQLFTNDAGTTATKIDLGANFPANRTAGSALTTIYQVQIYNPVGSSSVHYKVVNLETGNSVEGTVTTDIPSPTQALNFFASRCMGSPITNSGEFYLYNKFGVYSVA